jgi:hypothetical protein
LYLQHILTFFSLIISQIFLVENTESSELYHQNTISVSVLPFSTYCFNLSLSILAD